MAKPSTPGTAKVKRPRKPGVTVTLLDISLSGVAPVVGQSTSWSVTARYSNNTFKDITAASVLSSNNTPVANWTAQGILSAFTTGSVIITAVYQGQTVSQTLQIQSAPPTPPPPAPVTLLSLTLTALGSVPSIGGLQNYSVSGHFSDNTDQDLTALVAYSSSNHAVAAWVSQGTLQAISGGTSILTVDYQGITSSPTTINIATPPPPPPPIYLTQLRLNPPSAPNPAIGGTVKYTVTGIMSDGSLQDWTLLVTYHTGNAGIATWISPLGTLQGVAAGTCNIYVDTVVTVNNVLTTVTSPILTVTVPTNPTPPPPTVGGSTYYVSLTGNDSVTAQQATNPATPKKTFRNAVQLLKPGDQLLGRGGNYDEGLVTVPSGTSWSNKVRITNYPGEPVWLKPLVNNVNNDGFCLHFRTAASYIEFDGINMDARNMTVHNAIYFEGAPDIPLNTVTRIRLQNLEVFGAGGNAGYAGNILVNGDYHEFLNLKVHGTLAGYAYYVSGSFILIDRNDIYDVDFAGGQFYHGSAPFPNGCTLSNTKIHDITVPTYFLGQPDPGKRVNGWLVAGTNHNLFNNLIWNINVPGGYTGAAFDTFSGNSINLYNNTVASSSSITSFANLHSSTGIVARNNIAYGNAGNGISGGSSPIADHNLLGTNPLFVNPAIFDFRLQAGSPARNAGATIALVTTDIAGTPRPKGAAYDIGAYEYIE